MNRAQRELRHACKALMRDGSKSFFAASLVLPARVRHPARALYAFCRVADDAIDRSADPHTQCRRLHQRLDAIYAQQPGPEPADRALALLLQQHPLPRSVFDALLEGFAWDAERRRYERLDDLLAYAARVAGTVGALMAMLMETTDADALARACELGVAMQLTNIARDVGEDARNGRLYLPIEWLRSEGIDADAWLDEPVFDARIARVVQRLLREADRLYAHAECGIAALPRDCRAAIQAARLIYADIGRAIARSGFDAVHQRAVVAQRRKAWLLCRACAASLVTPGHPMDWAEHRAPLPAVRALVHATASRTLPDRTFKQRLVRTVDLFERVALRQRTLSETSEA
jgi:15-cis-phytoene synthase